MSKYLKRTDFRVYKCSRISRILVDFAKFSFECHSRKLIHAKYAQNP